MSTSARPIARTRRRTSSVEHGFRPSAVHCWSRSGRGYSRSRSAGNLRECPDARRHGRREPVRAWVGGDGSSHRGLIRQGLGVPRAGVLAALPVRRLRDRPDHVAAPAAALLDQRSVRSPSPCPRPSACRRRSARPRPRRSAPPSRRRSAPTSSPWLRSRFRPGHSTSTCTPVSGNGWHSGISVAVPWPP